MSSNTINKAGDETSEKITFSFGKNWQEYVRKHYSEERLEHAKRHMLKFLNVPDLQGKYFLDIGCGSGIHSLAALQAGADRIVSVDVDPASVETTNEVRRMHGNPSNWTVLHGSALDPAFLSTLEPADILYSWGVLHHTGDMWKAIENVAPLTRRGGVFYTALYLKGPKSAYWLAKKKQYNRASNLGKRWMEGWYIFREIFVHKTIHGHNPIKYITDYKTRRGMDFMTDVRDWLGGYPYEDVSVEEVLRFARQKLNMNMLDLHPVSAGMAEFLLEPRQ